MARPDADRNLLFGLLAFQNNFIDRAALLAAFNDWVEDKTRSIADILVERGALAPEFRAALDPLVEAHLRRHDNDAEKSLASLHVGNSTLDRLAALADTDLERTLSHVGPGLTLPEDPDRTPTFDVDARAADGPRFRVLR